MKIIPIQLLQSVHRTMCLRVQNELGEIYGFTDCDKKLFIDGVEYGAGMDLSSFQQLTDFSVNNAEVKFLPGQGIIDESDLLIGRWDVLVYVAFETDWTDTTEVTILSAGISGEVSQQDDGSFKSELRGLKQLFQNPKGFSTQATCRARFADFPSPTAFNVLCNLDPADWTVSSTITTVDSRRQVQDSARTEADDWFGMGIFTVTSGPNIGAMRIIRSYQDNTFLFDRPFDFEFFTGDSYEAIAGCRKRHGITSEFPDGISDCKTKFDNVVNFQGEPHTPGADAMSRGAYTII